jgi:hypothetical protein
MATNPNYPLVVTQVALNGGLATAESSLVWTELSTRVWEMDSTSGRQYELDQVQAGEGALVFADRDEALNPTNTSSPYTGQLLPYRPYMQQAMWPPAAIGAAVNLAGTTAGFDPSMESTAVGATPPSLVEFGVTATVVAANAHTGTHSLQWSVASGGGTQVAGFQVMCIPGRQYTASVFYRQTAANTGTIFVNGGAGGSTTTTTGAYVRLSVTFTATAMLHQLYVGSTAPGSNSTVNIDDFQLETGASASTFATTGPVIYGVCRGFIERWPAAWNYKGLYGYCKATTVDAFAALAAKELRTEYPTEVLGLAPDFYWALSEPDTATSYGDTSGNNGPALVQYSSKYGAGTAPKGGDDMGIVGDPSGTGVAFTPVGTPGSLTAAGTILGAGPMINNTPALTLPASIGTSWGVSVAAWVKIASNGGATQVLIRAQNSVSAAAGGVSAFIPIQITLDNPAPGVGFQNVAGGTGFIRGQNAAVSIADGLLHHVVGTVTQVNGGNTVLSIYVDGALSGQLTVTTASVGGMLAQQATSIAVGGYYDGSSFGFECDGPVSHLAIWNRGLSAGEVTALYTAGTGYPGESFHDRVLRYLVAGPYTGLVEVDAGSSMLGASALADQTKLLDALQSLVVTEAGNMWADSSGVLQCAGRARRYFNTTAQWTVGESQSGGEYPYEDDIAFDFDPTLVWNDVEVTQTGGIKVTAVDAASEAAYGPRSYQREINVASAAEAQDAANWILATHKDPRQRVSQLTLRPSANPALWPMALGAQIGDRVTAKRRTTSGSGISSDFFIEQITHTQKPGDWTVQYQMSPVGATGQPWILGDATYGVLGTTTVLGY